MSGSDDKPSGFTVTDRRSMANADVAKASSADAAAKREPSPERAAPPASQTFPQVDFATFVVSLGSSVLYHLGISGEDGEAAAPGGTKDLPMAKHTIDILEMLQAKSKGNLSPDEETLIESLLYDLRLRFVTASKG